MSDPRNAAKRAGLIYVNDDLPGITRIRAGKGFSYRDPKGRRIADRAERNRLAAIAVPPAYRDVWICPDPRGHIQATGRDARGRKQYLYHPDFRAFREHAKFDHMVEFAQVLPTIRAQVRKDMARRGLSACKVLATVVFLLEYTLIRVGNDDYARQNNSRGLTTLRGRHVQLHASKVRFHFKGKGGKEWDLSVRNPRVARIIRLIQDLPGQHLFQYRDKDGAKQKIGSTDVNDYLRDISGQEVTAKDFRTWAGTVLAMRELSRYADFESEADAKRNIGEAVATVANRLGNTPAICRKCYIHPRIIDAYLSGKLGPEPRGEQNSRQQVTGLRSDEKRVLKLLGGKRQA